MTFLYPVWQANPLSKWCTAVRAEKESEVFKSKVNGRKSKIGAARQVRPTCSQDRHLGPSAILLGFILLLVSSTLASAATIQGTVLDPNGAAVPRAKVTLLSSLAAVEERQTDARGQYKFDNLPGGVYKLIATVPGFSTSTTEVSVQGAEARDADLKLEISALQQQVVVSASLAGALSTHIGASVSVVSGEEIEDRNAQIVPDVLRGLPGVAVNQSGRRGGVTSVFIRGGDSNYNLVMVDGIQLNQFGGDFDFASLATDGVERVEVIRGPESALYGSNSVSGVVNIISRRGEGRPHFSFLGEGGSYATRRLAIGGSGLNRGFNWAFNLSRLDTDGVVQNDAYRNQSVFASFGYTKGLRQVNFHFFGNANAAGAPGPYGSDPDHLFDAPIYLGGPTPREVGLTARDKQNLFGYQGSYSEQFSQRFRQVVTASVATDDYYFSSVLGDSFSNNLRGVFNTRSEISLASSNFVVLGFEYNREQIKNTFIANSNNTPFLLPRTSLAYFAEDRWNPTNRWYLTAGFRVDDIRTAGLRPQQFVRPPLPPSSVVKVNPRLAVAYLAHQPAAQGSWWGTTRLHGTFGTGIRPPDGFELAFTDNPRLKPEQTVSFDLGAEQRILDDHVIGDVTYFFNRFRDQIVVLGGSLTSLSSFMSDNLANSQAQGVEVSVRTRPLRSLEITGAYTYLDSQVLALDRASLAQFPFRVGQPLIRRPRNSGGYNVTWRHRRLTLNTDASIRGSVLDIEPNDGSFACTLGLRCLFGAKGYFLANAGFFYRLPHGLDVYGRLNNVLNQKYEESLGFPALHLNFMAGVRFNFPAE